MAAKRKPKRPAPLHGVDLDLAAAVAAQGVSPRVLRWFRSLAAGERKRGTVPREPGRVAEITTHRPG